MNFTLYQFDYAEQNVREQYRSDSVIFCNIVNTYGLKIDTVLRDQVLARVEKLDRAVYTGFVMPKLEPVKNNKGEIVDVKISYPLDLGKQMLEYSAFTKKEKEKALHVLGIQQ
ncbi:MAG TPA: hypothetical protein VNJ29_00995 [Candidatus Nitrosotenuis sp.]|nr:hypothetical protein [Candidatus Nitrosotenuis sp.]